MNSFDQLFQVVTTRPVVDLWHLPIDLNWRNPVVLGQVKALVHAVLLAPGDAQDILTQLSKIKDDQRFAAESPALYRGWQEVMDHLSFIALLFLSPAEVERLFKMRLLFVVQAGLDLQGIVYTYLAVSGDDVTTGEKRQLLINALRSNEERLGQRVTKIVPYGSMNPLVPAVKNWLSDYEAVEVGKENRGAFEQSNYLTKSKNVTMLSGEEKGVLGKIIKLYDFLRFEPALLPSLEFEFGLKKTPVSARSQTAKGIFRPQPSQSPQIIDGSSLGQPTGVRYNIKKTPTALKSPEPAFFFDMSDEEEVDQFRIKNQELGIKNTLEGNLRLLAEEVIAEHNFQFKEAVSRRRFVQLFVSFMKDVRDIMEVKESLLKNTAAGGLGLPSDKVDIVVNIFRKLRAELPERMKDWEKVTLATSSPALPAGAGLPLVPSISSGTRNEERGTKTPAPMPKLIPQVQPSVKATPDELAEWRQELLAEIAKTSSAPKPKLTVPKPKLVDVAAPPRTLGPIEELKTMKLGDFRRLGKTAVDVVDKIKSKIQLISETGIGRHMQAIKAWQASPVYQIYITIGGSSIEQAKSVEDIIATRQSAGQETLTLSEFEAIVDLNQKLRF